MQYLKDKANSSNSIKGIILGKFSIMIVVKRLYIKPPLLLPHFAIPTADGFHLSLEKAPGHGQVSCLSHSSSQPPPCAYAVFFLIGV